MDAVGQLIGAWRQFDASEDGIVAADLLAYLYPPQRDQMPMDDASVAMAEPWRTS